MITCHDLQASFEATFFLFEMEKLEECVLRVLEDDWEEESYPPDSSGGADADSEVQSAGREAAVEQLRRVIADLMESSPPHLQEGLQKCHGNSPFFVIYSTGGIL